jgi:phosphohistidine phosphatase
VGQVPYYFYEQSAVIPYRCNEGTLEVLMITSRKKKRWVMPKGVIEPELCARTSATKEALEEAGIEGSVSDAPVGTYRYKKWGGICRVHVYVMRVKKVLEKWEESHRDREWVSLQEAVERTEEEDLRNLIRSLADFVAISAQSQQIVP